MKRRPLGRDLGLSIRMAVALIPILAWYLVALLLLVGIVIGTLVDREWDAFLGAALFAVGGQCSFGSTFTAPSPWRSGPRAPGSSPRTTRPDLQALIARVAAMANLPPPRVALARSWAPNAFSVGLNERRAVVRGHDRVAAS
jgi:heat shock protein HtpX